MKIGRKGYQKRRNSVETCDSEDIIGVNMRAWKEINTQIKKTMVDLLLVMINFYFLNWGSVKFDFHNWESRISDFPSWGCRIF